MLKNKGVICIMGPISGMDNVNQVIAKGDVILGFSSPTCGYCRKMRPMMEKIAGSLPVPIYGVNVEEDKDVAERFEVTATPTLIYFHNGKPVDRIVGSNGVGFEDLKAFVERSHK